MSEKEKDNKSETRRSVGGAHSSGVIKISPTGICTPTAKASVTELPRKPVALAIADKLFKCATCRQRFPEVVTIERDGITVCPQCLAEHYAKCSGCGLPTHKDMLRTVYPDAEPPFQLCVECYHNSNCPACSKDVDKKTAPLVLVHDQVVCAKCANVVRWVGLEDVDLLRKPHSLPPSNAATPTQTLIIAPNERTIPAVTELPIVLESNIALEGPKQQPTASADPHKSDSKAPAAANKRNSANEEGAKRSSHNLTSNPKSSQSASAAGSAEKNIPKSARGSQNKV